jgi:hypothetical protein
VIVAQRKPASNSLWDYGRCRLHLRCRYGQHFIRRVDRRAHQVTTIAGSRKAGRDDGRAREASFEEPTGLTLADGVLYIADAQSHSIRALDLTELTVSTLSLKLSSAGS